MSTKELGSRAGTGRDSGKDFFSPKCHRVTCSSLVISGGQKVYEVGLPATSSELSLPLLHGPGKVLQSDSPDTTYMMSLSVSFAKAWEAAHKALSSEDLSGCWVSSHTWISAAPISWGRKVCSDIKQSVSIPISETAGMMSGPHRGSGR